MSVGERSTFAVVGYLHFPETAESAAFLENAKRHKHAFLIGTVIMNIIACVSPNCSLTAGTARNPRRVQIFPQCKILDEAILMGLL